MRKVVIAMLASMALAIAAASIWFLWQNAGGRATSLLDELDSSQTLAAMELRSLDKLAKQGLEALDAAALKQLPAEFNRPAIVARLGGDPGDAQAWQAWGLDPATGIALVADRRLMRSEQRTPLPVALARVTDRGKLQAALAKAGLTVTLGKQLGAIQELTVSGEALWLGGEGERLALMPVPGGASPQELALLRAGFEGFLRGGGTPLAKHGGFAKARRDAGDRYLLAWADNTALMALQPRAEVGADLAFFGGLFPYQAAWLSDRSGWRIGATAAGRTALAEIVKPKRNPPRCARLLPKTGWAGARLSANLLEATGGIGKLLPPSTPASTRTALPAATAMLAFTGVGWGEITEAFSGHLCGGVDMASALATASTGGKALPTWLVAVGVVDAPKADALVAKLIGLFAGKSGVTATEITIQGKKGWQLQAGPLGAVVARLDDAVLIAPSSAVLLAAGERSKGDSLADTAVVEALDGDVFVGAVADIQPVMDAARAALAGDKNAQQVGPLLEQWAKKLQGQRYFGASLQLDGEGVLLRAIGDPQLQATLLGVAPLVAAFAVPAFLRYSNQSKTIEARADLDRLARAAAVWYGEAHADAPACQFPPSAPPNPPQSCCEPAMDADGDRRCDASSWQLGPTWQALGIEGGSDSRYRYEFESSGSLGEARFVLSAYADLDCDGQASTFRITGRGKMGDDGACSAVVDPLTSDRPEE